MTGICYTVVKEVNPPGGFPAFCEAGSGACGGGETRRRPCCNVKPAAGGRLNGDLYETEIEAAAVPGAGVQHDDESAVDQRVGDGRGEGGLRLYRNLGQRPGGDPCGGPGGGAAGAERDHR